MTPTCGGSPGSWTNQSRCVLALYRAVQEQLWGAVSHVHVSVSDIIEALAQCRIKL